MYDLWLIWMDWARTEHLIYIYLKIITWTSRTNELGTLGANLSVLHSWKFVLRLCESFCPGNKLIASIFLIQRPCNHFLVPIFSPRARKPYIFEPSEIFVFYAPWLQAWTCRCVIEKSELMIAFMGNVLISSVSIPTWTPHELKQKGSIQL